MNRDEGRAPRAHVCLRSSQAPSLARYLWIYEWERLSPQFVPEICVCPVRRCEAKESRWVYDAPNVTRGEEWQAGIERGKKLAGCGLSAPATQITLIPDSSGRRSPRELIQRQQQSR